LREGLRNQGQETDQVQGQLSDEGYHPIGPSSEGPLIIAQSSHNRPFSAILHPREGLDDIISRTGKRYLEPLLMYPESDAFRPDEVLLSHQGRIT
jgi:hypothetical protein